MSKKICVCVQARLSSKRLSEKDGLGIHSTINLQGKTIFSPDTVNVDDLNSFGIESNGLTTCIQIVKYVKKNNRKVIKLKK